MFLPTWWGKIGEEDPSEVEAAWFDGTSTEPGVWWLGVNADSGMICLTRASRSLSGPQLPPLTMWVGGDGWAAWPQRPFLLHAVFSHASSPVCGLVAVGERSCSVGNTFFPLAGKGGHKQGRHLLPVHPQDLTCGCRGTLWPRSMTFCHLLLYIFHDCGFCSWGDGQSWQRRRGRLSGDPVWESPVRLGHSIPGEFHGHCTPHREGPQTPEQPSLLSHSPFYSPSESSGSALSPVTSWPQERKLESCPRRGRCTLKSGCCRRWRSAAFTAAQSNKLPCEWARPWGICSSLWGGSLCSWAWEVGGERYSQASSAPGDG